MIDEERVITPTIQTLLAKKKRRQEALYIHVPLPLVEAVAPLGAQPAYLFMVLYSVQRMHPEKRYFWMRPDFEAAVGRGPRWWHAHTQALEAAGVIEVIRKVGAKPRYRLLGIAIKQLRTGAALRSGG